MAPRIGLYYPFIHFRDDVWVKLAALYWARLARIVPPGYATQDSRVVRALGEEFVINVSPLGAAPSLNQRFVDVLTAHSKKLRGAYGVDQSAAWKPDPITAQRMESAGIPSEGVETAFAYLHAAKLTPELRDRLVDEGLAVPTRGDDPSWIGVHPTVARIYMTALADEISTASADSKSRLLYPITDDALDHVAVAGWTIDRLAAALLNEPSVAHRETDEHAADVGLAFIAIEAVVPKDLSSVPVERIIEVREKYRTELVQFLTAVEAIGHGLESLGEVDDPKLVKAYLEVAHEERIKPHLETLKRDLRLFHIETVASAATIKVTAPPALSSLASGLGMGVDPVLAAGSGAVLGLASLISGRHARASRLMRESPAAYLFRVEEGLTPATLLKRVGQRIRGFVSGV